MAKTKPPALRPTPGSTATTTVRARKDGQVIKRATVWLPLDVAEALTAAAYEEWRARAEPRGHQDAGEIIERALRADPSVARQLEALRRGAR